jgi:hypothetical protein
MSALHTIDHASKLIVTTWEGGVTDVEFIDAFKKYQEEIQKNQDFIGYNEVLDVTNASNIKLSSEGIEYLADLASVTDQDVHHRRFAIIVNSPLAYGLARMYAIYRGFTKSRTKSLRVFNDRKKAFEWVCVDK